MELSEIQQHEWYKSRPRAVQARIDTHPPISLYRMKPTGQIVCIYSYEEKDDGKCNTCKVNVLRKYNPFILFERTVFGVPFDDLEMIEP